MVTIRGKSTKWINDLKIDDKIRLTKDIYVRSSGLGNFIVDNFSNNVFYNWYEENEEFTIAGKIGRYYILEDNYKCFSLKVTEEQLSEYFIKNNINYMDCYYCKNTFTMIGRVKKGIIVECPKCGKKFICIDHNRYIDRWRDYNENK